MIDETGDDVERPLLSVRDLSMNASRGRVFGPLDWDLYRGQRGIVAGHQGSGRSALLLALGGRLKGVDGLIVLQDFDGVLHPRKLRSLTSIAQIADLATLEPGLRVGEARDERALAEGMSVREGREQFSLLQDQVGHYYDPEEITEHLPGVYRTLLAALLGCLRSSQYILMDDVDHSLTDEQLGWIHHKLDLLAGYGHTFIVSTLDTAVIPANANTLQLADPVSMESAAPVLTPSSPATPTSPPTPSDYEDA